MIIRQWSSSSIAKLLVDLANLPSYQAAIWWIRISELAGSISPALKGFKQKRHKQAKLVRKFPPAQILRHTTCVARTSLSSMHPGSSNESQTYEKNILRVRTCLLVPATGRLLAMAHSVGFCTPIPNPFEELR